MQSSIQAGSWASTVRAFGRGWTRAQSRLRVFTNASLTPLPSGLLAGVKQGTREKAAAKSIVSRAA